MQLFGVTIKRLAKKSISLVKQYRDNKCAVWIRQEYRKRLLLPKA